MAPPKKSTTSSKKTAPAKPKFNHPTYQVMISEAISALRDRTGSSLIAICKYMEANYTLQPEFKEEVKKALKRLLTKGVLEKVLASYKLTEAGKLEHKKHQKEKKKAAGGSTTTTKKTTAAAADSDSGSDEEAPAPEPPKKKTAPPKKPAAPAKKKAPAAPKKPTSKSSKKNAAKKSTTKK